MRKMTWRWIAALLLVPAGLSAGPLEDFLTNKPPQVNPTWPDGCDPRIDIPLSLERMKSGPDPEDRGTAVGELTLSARLLAEIPKLRPAAAELIDRHIMPNLELTRKLDETSFSSWRRTVIGCKSAYQNIGNREAVERCLTMLEQGSPLEDDRYMVFYLRAYLRAGDGRYPEAIAELNRIPAENHWSAQRETLTKQWTQKQTELENKAKEQELKKKRAAEKQAEAAKNKTKHP